MPPRIGELLVKAGAVDPDGVRAALQNQVIFGGRLGTNLLEIGRVSEEALADALGRRHGAPALSGDLKLDPKVLALLRADVADRHDVVPYLLSGRRLAVLVVDPADLAMLDEVAFATGKQVHPIVVPEARLWALLRSGYGIDRQLRGIDVDFGSLQRAVAAPAAELAPIAGVTQDLIDEGDFAALYGKAGTGAWALDGAPPAQPAPPPAAEEEIVELTELLAPEPDVAPVVLAAIEAGTGHAPPARLAAPAAPAVAEEPEPTPLGFDAAVAALEGVTDRNAIARTVLRYARSRFRRAVLLTVNRGAALGWQGTGDGLAGAGARRLRIALGTPGVLDTVARTRAHFLGPLAKTEANVRLLKQLAGGVPGNALVVPILALGRVVNLIYADAGRGALVDATGVGELLILATRIARGYESLVARVR